MPQKESILLFGEGKSDAVFLKHLCALYHEDLKGTRIKIDAGRGGSPRQILSQLVNRHLRLGNFDRALLLLDEDLGRDQLPMGIEVVNSSPGCLEGMLLKLLGAELTNKERHSSARLKRKFRKEYLQTDRDAEIVRKFKFGCPKLFPRERLDEKRAKIGELDVILSFLRL